MSGIKYCEKTGKTMLYRGCHIVMSLEIYILKKIRISVALSMDGLKCVVTRSTQKAL
jgi:hypothetical protein